VYVVAAREKFPRGKISRGGGYVRIPLGQKDRSITEPFIDKTGI